MKPQATMISKLKHLTLAIIATGFLAVGGATAKADYLDLNIAGWSTHGVFGDLANSEVFLNLGAGTAITGYDFLNLSVTATDPSWRSEFILSLNDTTGNQFMDYRPSTLQTTGSFGPISGSWAVVSGQGYGAPFSLLADGLLWVTVYETFNDELFPDATVTSGTLRIYYTAVPEPATASLLGLGLLGVTFWRKNRRH